MPFTVKWIGQGGYEIRMGDTVLMIDPYMSDFLDGTGKYERLVRPAYSFHEVHPHYLLCTHDHSDHLDPELIKAMPKDGVTFIGPGTVARHLYQLGVPEGQVIQLDRGGRFVIGDITIQAGYAEHTEDSIGVKLSYGGKSLYFTGDSLYNEKTAADITGIDILFTCINGRWGNMNHTEAAALAKRIRPRLAIPNHYGMFEANNANPEDFYAATKGSNIYVYIHKYLETIDILNSGVEYR